MDRAIRANGAYVFGPFRLDAARRELTCEGAPVALTPTLFDTLLYLVKNPNRVVTKDELLAGIWPGRLVEESNLTQTIFTLRRALKEAGAADRLIVTAPGRGYRFTASPTPVDGASRPVGSATPGEVVIWPFAPKLARETSPDFPASWRRRPILSAAALGALVLAMVGLAAVFGTWRAAAPARASGSVVLARFRNLTGDPVFDGSLDKVVEADLDQSPYLHVLPQRRVEDTLALMTRSRDEALTAPLAQEVCARNNAAFVASGTVAAFGARYLVTLTATDCSGASVLTAAKATVLGREAVVPALDGLIGVVRRKLGESARSLRQFDVPLLSERTASLTALKAYSEGDWLYNHGRPVEAIPLYQRAVEIDPNFAAAYAALSTVYAGFYDSKLDIANISRAYALRNTVGERQRLLIAARYHQSVTKDLNAAIRDLRTWSDIYPRDAVAWVNLADAEDYLGRYDQEIADARRALALDPSLETAYAALARAYLGAGRIGEARGIAARAAGKGLAGDDVHETLLLVAFAGGDGRGVDEQIAWARGRSAERTTLVREDEIALGQGKVREADGVFARLVGLGREQGLPDDSRASHARQLAALGLTDRARALLVELGDDSNPDYLITVAEIGDVGRARAMLTRHLREGPDDTLLNAVYAPQARAALAMRRGEPGQAIAALQPAAPYESCDFDVPYMLASAFLTLGDGGRAAAEFQKILDHRGWDATSPLYPLARLGLARAYRLEGNLPASRRAYQTFLTTWKDADPDLPILRAAKAEYAAL